ncbi:probable ATP-dependent RNA helicase DDX28 isoform X2 [Agrilus planipennis]|uniref:Probable ATP-dependent RNA helicase DDX28 isoform X2 n=1 Tax=Agrilus planipennis TaxID=224129 RepID=A0A1W4XJ09_AGRPL|nr:probable ATP-dependent RNA helicase DDX28 isoform X2 [Agrilus planipennis]
MITSNSFIASYFHIVKLVRYYSLNYLRSPESIKDPLISCKRSDFNYYKNNKVTKFEAIKLASKGWTHNKSKGDYFIIHPQLNIEEDTKPFHFLTKSFLADALRKEKIYSATPFQEKVIDYLKTGKHALVAAETGSGKTISYLLPIIEKLINNPATNVNTPKALILIPNRELALQIGNVAQKLCEVTNLKIKTIIGGRTKKIMVNPEFSEIDILIGTPGHTIIDEADTLLDDSFEERVAVILKKTVQSQIVLVSATIPKNLPEYLKPIEAALTQIISPKVHMPLFNIKQHFLRLSKTSKPSELLSHAKKASAPMIIFSNRNETSNWVALFLRENGLKCSNINGDMNFAIRIQQWNQFLSGENKILSSTDICSRGLNTVQVKHVINYDFPLYASDYIHRIGRIGRIGSPANCKVTNFITGPKEVQLVQQIEIAIRTGTTIPNVDGNITKIIQSKIMREEN